MRQLDFKKTTVNLESKRATWESLGVPREIEDGLLTMAFAKPSIIQAVSIPQVMAERESNFLFQAINGSGKTGAFAVPSLMIVDPKVPKIQVLILANTRELMRQIEGVLLNIGQKT